MRTDDGREVSSACYAHLLLMSIKYERNELVEAGEQLKCALALSSEGKEPVVWFLCQMMQALIYAVSGAEKQAMDTALMARLSFEATISDSTLSQLQYSRLLLLCGDSESAATHMTAFSDVEKSDWSDTSVRADVMRKYVFGSDVRNVTAEAPLLGYARVLLATNRLEGLPKMLSIIHAETKRRGHILILLNTLILEALTAEALGDSRASSEFLDCALDISEPNGLLRVYADEGKNMRRLLRRARAEGSHTDHVSKILELFGDIENVSTKVKTVKVSGLSEPFTKRELQLLHMICTGASNKEMADKLYLSLSTVKNHIHNIYSKMGVTSRAQAIVKSRELDFANWSNNSAKLPS